MYHKNKKSYGYGGTIKQRLGGTVDYGLGGAALKFGSNLVQNLQQGKKLGDGLLQGTLQGVGKAAITPGSGIGAGAQLAGNLLQGANNPLLQKVGQGLDVASNFAPGGGGIAGAVGDVAGLVGGGAGAAGAAGAQGQGLVNTIANLAGQGGGAGGQGVGNLLNLASNFLGEQGMAVPLKNKNFMKHSMAAGGYGSPRMRAAAGIKLMKRGGMPKVYAQGGTKTPPVHDLANIRLLQNFGTESGVPTNEFYLRQGDDQYTPIATGNAALRDMLGEERFFEYMNSIGMTPKTDAGGKQIGFDRMQLVDDLDPYERATKAFTEEFYGNQDDRSSLQRDHYKTFVDAVGPHELEQTGGEIGPGGTRYGMDDYHPATMRKMQAEYLINILGGGTGGSKGSMFAGGQSPRKGVKLMKRGGMPNIYAQDGNKNPTIDDIANIRLLAGTDGPGSHQFFLRQGDDQYAPLGDLKELRAQLGDDRYGEYMSGLGFKVKRDKQGKEIIGMEPVVSGADILRDQGFSGLPGPSLDPYQRASSSFVDEYFGASMGRDRGGFGDKVYDRDETQKAHHAAFVQSLEDAQGPFVGLMDEYIQKYGTERGPGMFVAQMDSKSKRPQQEAFMMSQLLGGQGGGRGGM